MIFIITQRDPFFIDSFLEEFDKFDIPYTVLDLPSFNKGFGAGLKKALLLYGFIGFFVYQIIRVFAVYMGGYHPKYFPETFPVEDIEHFFVSYI